MTREQLRASMTDRIALVCTLFGECAGEAIQGQIAVACVIRNRVLRDIGADGKPDWWQEGYRGVCLAPWQFSCWHEKNQNTDRVYALAQALMDQQPVGPVVTELQWIAEGVMGGALRDVTRGSDHYLTTALLRSSKAPAWALKSPSVVTIGSHTFFRLN